MTAVLIPTAGEAEWLEARRKGITASEIAIVMGLSPYSSPYKLYHQKLGILPADEDNAAMERGRVLEPYIADKFWQAHQEWLVVGDGRGLYAHGERSWQMATPDRMLCTAHTEGDNGEFWTVEDPFAVLETKTDAGSDEWGEPGTDEIPVHYRCQVLWQMDVMGVDHAYVACLRIRDWRVLEYEVHMDDDARKDLKLMVYEAKAFLMRVNFGQVPDVDWRPATTDALKTLHASVEDRDVVIGRQLAISYRAAVRRCKAAEQRKDEMTNRVLAAMGDARRAVEACTDLPVATRSVSHPRRVSTTMLREKYPAIAAECTPEPSPQIKLTPAKPKKDKTS